MLMSRVLSRASRSFGQRSLLPLLSASQKQQLPILSNQLHSIAHQYPNKIISGQVGVSHRSGLNPSFIQRFGFNSSASSEVPEKEQGSTAETNVEVETPNEESNLDAGSNLEPEPKSTKPGTAKGGKQGTKRAAFSDSDSSSSSDSDSDAESDLSKDDLIKLVAEKDEALELKHKELEEMKNKALRAFAEMENVRERTKREAENTKKFAIQNFAKSLLDVSDNLGRASSVVKSSFAKLDVSDDPSGAVPLLKTLLEGVEMTEKQLDSVFKKFGLEKFDPTNEPFDPHRHCAVFQVPDPSKPPGTVAAVLKTGYVLFDRVIRPAEVGVTQAVEGDAEADNAAKKGSDE